MANVTNQAIIPNIHPQKEATTLPSHAFVVSPLGISFNSHKTLTEYTASAAYCQQILLFALRKLTELRPVVPLADETRYFTYIIVTQIPRL